jgi:OFA family oxalate/formate antiporter-like MFS transporter
MMSRFRIRPVAGQPVFYGWYIVAVAFFANFVSIGSAFYAMNAFMEPLCQTHGWSRTDVNLAMVWGTLFGYPGQFVWGSLVNRFPIRHLMLGGAVSAGAVFMLFTHASVLWQFYVLYVLLYLANGAYGGIVSNTVVSNWFRKKRGRALGIASAGISLSGVLLPMTAMLLTLRWGMHRAAFLLGVGIVAVGLLAWVIVRDWPEACGLQPDGMRNDQGRFMAPEPGKGGHRIQAGAGTWNPSRLMKTPDFWKTGFAFALIMTGAMGVMSQLKPRFADIGFNDLTAMVLMSATALVATIGKYVWGMLCDRFGAGRVAIFLAAANALGLLPAFFGNTIPGAVLFILCFGFAMGGTMAVYPILVAERFGRRSFPAVYRFMALFMIIQMAGFLIAGQSYDRTGSYDVGYAIFIMLDMVAAGLLIGLWYPGRFRYRRRSSK